MSLMAPTPGLIVLSQNCAGIAGDRQAGGRAAAAIAVEVRGRAIRVKLATERSEFEQAFRLLASRYEERGYDRRGSAEFRFTPSHALPETVMFVAKDGDRVVATLSLVPDNEVLGLPMERLYGEEVDDLRRAGRRLGEVISLADDGLGHRDFLRVFLAMIRMMFQYHVRHGGDSWVITVNPRHRSFYRKALGFVPLGPCRSYEAVGGHPAEAFLLDLDLMRENAPERHREIFGEPLPAPVLTATVRPADFARDFGPRSSQADYPTILRVLSASQRDRHEVRQPWPASKTDQSASPRRGGGLRWHRAAAWASPAVAVR